jgi:hypothetical protein
VQGSADEVLVTFAGHQGQVRVPVRRAAEAVEVQKSCGAEPEPVHPYRAG